MIEACNGNLEMAVNMHMEGMAGTSGVEPVEDYVRAPIPQKQEVLVPSGYEGYGFGQKGKRRIIKSVFDSFRNFEVEASKKLFLLFLLYFSISTPFYMIFFYIRITGIKTHEQSGCVHVRE
jgi:hypothetical protein